MCQPNDWRTYYLGKWRGYPTGAAAESEVCAPFPAVSQGLRAELVKAISASGSGPRRPLGPEGQAKASSQSVGAGVQRSHLGLTTVDTRGTWIVYTSELRVSVWVRASPLSRQPRAASARTGDGLRLEAAARSLAAQVCPPRAGPRACEQGSPSCATHLPPCCERPTCALLRGVHHDLCIFGTDDGRGWGHTGEGEKDSFSWSIASPTMDAATMATAPALPITVVTPTCRCTRSS
ncbi:PREDICTED: histone-lysine N-methyltransferase SUV39H1-like [Elephantulus edwardii]|uniref:histone-lysine N-methyltransferase SUV39H1-like n=1 Tax=Elephantulus edwardii TaxID=28737 RepID=UPI0003F0E0D8|nr:PREDICTED: histone-lysine N-methyltransferase SUV39H1-like [Elephantulus edwardii]